MKVEMQFIKLIFLSLIGSICFAKADDCCIAQPYVETKDIMLKEVALA